MLIYFVSNNRSLKAEVNSFTLMHKYMWVNIDPKGWDFSFSDVSEISSVPTEGVAYQDVSDLIKQRDQAVGLGCAMHDRFSTKLDDSQQA